jgi:hypothetical protein
VLDRQSGFGYKSTAPTAAKEENDSNETEIDKPEVKLEEAKEVGANHDPIAPSPHAQEPCDPELANEHLVEADCDDVQPLAARKKKRQKKRMSVELPSVEDRGAPSAESIYTSVTANFTDPPPMTQVAFPMEESLQQPDRPKIHFLRNENIEAKLSKSQKIRQHKREKSHSGLPCQSVKYFGTVAVSETPSFPLVQSHPTSDAAFLLHRWMYATQLGTILQM